MTDHKKKGDFDQWQRRDEGGNKKAHKHARNSRTGHKQNAGHGGRRSDYSAARASNSIAARYFSASSAAMQPVPAAVTAWR